MGKVCTWKHLGIIILGLSWTNSLSANEFVFNFGGGPQLGSDHTAAEGDQINTTAGIDYSFYRHDRSPRSSFHVGLSYTYMRANSDEFDEIHAVTLYPQLTMYPTQKSWVRSIVPGDSEPFFYVRALGPSYISANRLGTRQQANNFAFQAQIGAGLLLHTSRDRQAIIAISWKHYSNANLFDENDGIDLPIVLNFGVRF